MDSLCLCVCVCVCGVHGGCVAACTCARVYEFPCSDLGGWVGGWGGQVIDIFRL